jgi:hypothetical protein
VSETNQPHDPTTRIPGTASPNGHGAQGQGPVGAGSATEKQAQLDAFRVDDDSSLYTTDQTSTRAGPTAAGRWARSARHSSTRSAAAATSREESEWCPPDLSSLRLTVGS